MTWTDAGICGLGGRNREVSGISAAKSAGGFLTWAELELCRCMVGLPGRILAERWLEYTCCALAVAVGPPPIEDLLLVK